MNCKYKSNMTKKKAFTLIELLIVIAIIGILFIVLVSKVDFATDKAKASGVQTDFRSFQVALETVSKENAGFNTFGWDTGDNAGAAPAGYTYTNADKDAGDRIRNSYDEGDTNLNGQYDDGEVWTGRKVYTENWTGCYTLINPGDSSDMSAIFDLQTAINKNLDPKLHINIADDGTITMANGLKDPWSTQYHGRYITNASADAAAKWNTDASMAGSTGDNMDRGAILMYSNGANQKFGTKVKIVGGVVTATVSQIDADHPDNNKMGADDYVLAVVYSYTNGYGEVMSPTWGFSQNNIPSTGNGGYNSNELNKENNNQSQSVHQIGFKYNTIYHMSLNGSMATNEGSAMAMMFNENGTCTCYRLMINNNQTMGVIDMEFVAELLNSKNGGTYTVNPTLSTVTVKSADGTTYEKNLYKIYMQLDFELFGSDLWSAEIAYDPIEDIFYGAIGDVYGDILNLTEQISVDSTKSIQFNKEYRYIGENNIETLTILFKESGEMYLNGVLAASNMHYKDQLVYNDDLSIMICVSFDGQYIVHENEYYQSE